MYKNRVRQQYGIEAERVQQELNSIGEVINLNEIPPELKYLLFRDTGRGNRLVTKKIAKDMKEGLEQLALKSEEEFQAMLVRLQLMHKTEDIPYIQ